MDKFFSNLDFLYISHMCVWNTKIKVKSHFKKESIRLAFKDVKMSYFDIARAFHPGFSSRKWSFSKKDKTSQSI